MNDLRIRVKAKRGNEQQRRFRSRGYVHGAEVVVDASKPVHGHLRWALLTHPLSVEKTKELKNKQMKPNFLDMVPWYSGLINTWSLDGSDAISRREKFMWSIILHVVEYT
nr:metallo-dependent phosphatase-like protein [Tanacetum cinerariifolium]